MNDLRIQENPSGATFWVVVKPRSRKNELVDIREGSLCVRVTAPPVEGAANEACRKLLAKTLGISKSGIAIRKGETSPKKLIHCRNLTAQEVLDRILK